MTASNASEVLFFPFIALPNGGKGTQTQMLSTHFDMPRLDMGALLRNVAKEDSPLGLRVQERLAQGQLVSIEIVLDVLEDGVKKLLAQREQPKTPQGFILDGFPRNLEQAEALTALTSRMGAQVAAAIYLEVPVDVVRARAENRRICGQCGAIYNLLSKAPKVAGVCDVCGSTDLQHRHDDQPEQVAKRLVSFQEDTNPVLTYYEGRGLLSRVDGHGSVESVYNELEELIAGRLSQAASNPVLGTV